MSPQHIVCDGTTRQLPPTPKRRWGRGHENFCGVLGKMTLSTQHKPERQSTRWRFRPAEQHIIFDTSVLYILILHHLLLRLGHLTPSWRRPPPPPSQPMRVTREAKPLGPLAVGEEASSCTRACSLHPHRYSPSPLLGPPHVHAPASRCSALREREMWVRRW
jgi:hypothetical protein